MLQGFAPIQSFATFPCWLFFNVEPLRRPEGTSCCTETTNSAPPPVYNVTVCCSMNISFGAADASQARPSGWKYTFLLPFCTSNTCVLKGLKGVWHICSSLLCEGRQPGIKMTGTQGQGNEESHQRSCRNLSEWRHLQNFTSQFICSLCFKLLQK